MSEGGLRVEHLTFGYGSGPVLKDVSFAIGRGQFGALLGPNGAGKTTLFTLLTRLADIQQGQVVIAGTDLRIAPRAALAKMGIVFQQLTLDLDLTVRRNLSYYAALRGLTGREAGRRIETALERLGISDKANVRARELNGGHRRRTEIARCLLDDPEVLLLDEPTVGLDPASRAAITGHVHRLCAEDGLTVLWATHLVDEVWPDDDLVIIHHGTILAHDRAASVAGGRSVGEVFLELTAEPA